MGEHQAEMRWKEACFVKKRNEKGRLTCVLRATCDSTPDVERPPGMKVGTTTRSKSCWEQRHLQRHLRGLLRDMPNLALQLKPSTSCVQILLRRTKVSTWRCGAVLR